MLLSSCGSSGGGGSADPTTSSNSTPNPSSTGTTTTSSIPAVHVPTISNFQYSDNTATQNQGSGALTVTGTLDFIDAGGDLKTLTVNCYNSSGAIVNTIDFPVTNVAGQTTGRVNVSIVMSTAVVMDYTFNIFATDGQDSNSNTLSGTFRVTASTPTSLGYTKTLLLRGKWHFVYTIVSTWTDDYSLATMSTTTNSQGGYYIFGTNQHGSLVTASYFPTDGNWSLLDDDYATIEQFYMFYTDGSTILPNSCYYLITKSTNAWSQCYSLSGSKTSTTPAPEFTIRNTALMLQKSDAILLEDVLVAPIDESTKEKYLQLQKMRNINN